MALADDLIAYWPMDETSGTRADAHTNNLDLSENGTPGYAAGNVYDNAVDYDATADEWVYVPAASSSSLEFSSATPFTLAAWCYLTAYAAGADSPDYYRYIFEHNNASNFTGGYRIQTSTTGTIYVQLGKSGGGTQYTWHASLQLSLNTWQLVALTHDSNNLVAYLDGATDTDTNAIAFTAASAKNFAVGARSSNGTYVWQGRIGPAAVWGRALSTTELDEFYNSGAGMTYAALTATGPAIPVVMHHRRTQGMS